MRAFERSHPWITFRVDLRAAPPALWMLLGEAASKVDHVGGVPLLPAVAQQLHQLYLAKGTLATTAIEGNTLTEQEVLEHLDGRLSLPPSKAYLAREIDNIAGACGRIGARIRAGTLGALSGDEIRRFNAEVLDGLALEPGVVPGRVRAYSVGVGRYRGAPPEDCDHLLERMVEWLEGPDLSAPEPDLEAPYAIVKAVVAHLYLAWIHPFGDGNGRTARLIEFRILAAAGFPTPAIHLLSNHYNLTRAEYYRQLQYASESGGDIIRFLSYALRGFVDGLRQQVATIREQVFVIVWRDYVNERFAGRKSASDERRRQLVLALSRPVPTPLADVPRLNPTLAAAYATKTPKTMSRDLEAVIGMDLVERTAEGYRARTESVLAFLPLRRDAVSGPSPRT
jgi:Fic family protein